MGNNNSAQDRKGRKDILEKRKPRDSFKGSSDNFSPEKKASRALSEKNVFEEEKDQLRARSRTGEERKSVEGKPSIQHTKTEARDLRRSMNEFLFRNRNSINFSSSDDSPQFKTVPRRRSLDQLERTNTTYLDSRADSAPGLMDIKNPSLEENQVSRREDQQDGSKGPSFPMSRSEIKDGTLERKNSEQAASGSAEFDSARAEVPGEDGAKSRAINKERTEDCALTQEKDVATEIEKKEGPKTSTNLEEKDVKEKRRSQQREDPKEKRISVFKDEKETKEKRMSQQKGSNTIEQKILSPKKHDDEGTSEVIPEEKSRNKEEKEENSSRKKEIDSDLMASDHEKEGRSFSDEKGRAVSKEKQSGGERDKPLKEPSKKSLKTSSKENVVSSSHAKPKRRDRSASYMEKSGSSSSREARDAVLEHERKNRQVVDISKEGTSESDPLNSNSGQFRSKSVLGISDTASSTSASFIVHKGHGKFGWENEPEV
eukprot:TRINITY_DN4333_c0_g1_i1.p1 TRINITY_DN4333_c0_g1~~TRINITY_DN4333_c0_g1_i1.p1  ORF type:complete len:486 (+),score=117.60 TRINITY_DN4333_c0_g1_i1:68-1525(+)